MKLVTGGAGYLGSHLAKKLLSLGETVRIFDVEKTKYVPENAEFIKGDMRNLGDVERAMEGVDTVFHLAFVQSLSKRTEREKWEINICGTENFFKTALEKNVRRFVHTSTIEIYGTHPPYPCYEDSPTDNPTGWYGRHKLECEWLCLKYVEKGLKAAMLRMPTICGPGHYNHGPMLDVMDRIIDSKPLGVVGNGKIYGSYVHFEDVLAAYLLAAEKEEAIGEAFNIAAEKAATHYQILKSMINAVNSKSIIFHIPRQIVRPGVKFLNTMGWIDVPEHQIGYLFYHNYYAVDKAMKMLGYAPKWTTVESAAELIKGYLSDREFVRERNKSY